MKIISTDKAPGAVGPYSQAIVSNGFVFASGQIALNPLTGQVNGSSIQEQAHQVCRNVRALLEAAGSDISKVVKTTCFLAYMADFADFNAVYAGYFTSKPARSCVAVKELPMGVLCEIEVIAELNEPEPEEEPEAEAEE